MSERYDTSDAADVADAADATRLGARPDPGQHPPEAGARGEVQPRHGEEVDRAADQVDHLQRHQRPMNDPAGTVPERRQDSSGDTD